MSAQDIVNNLIESIIAIVIPIHDEILECSDPDETLTKSTSIYSLPEDDDYEDDQVIPGFDFSKQASSKSAPSILSDYEVPSEMVEDYEEYPEFYEQKITKKLVHTDALNVSRENIIGGHGDKKSQEVNNETIYHGLCQVQMPKFLNGPPRLGLSKRSKVEPLLKSNSKRPKIMN